MELVGLCPTSGYFCPTGIRVGSCLGSRLPGDWNSRFLQPQVCLGGVHGFSFLEEFLPSGGVPVGQGCTHGVGCGAGKQRGHHRAKSGSLVRAQLSSSWAGRTRGWRCQMCTCGSCWPNDQIRPHANTPGLRAAPVTEGRRDSGTRTLPGSGRREPGQEHNTLGWASSSPLDLPGHSLSH